MKNSDMTIGDMVRVSTRDEDSRHVYYDQIGLIVGTWKNHKNKLQTLDVLLGKRRNQERWPMVSWSDQ